MLIRDLHCSTFDIVALSMSSEKQPIKVLKPFKEALEFWSVQLEKPDELNTAVPAATLEDPLKELIKLSALIRAQTTKVGIIYAPSTIRKQTEAAHDTVAELSKTFVFYVSALAQLSPVKVSKLFLDEVVTISKDLIGSASEFADELILILESLDGQNDDKNEEAAPESVNSRLLSVGKLWLLCDKIKDFIEKGNLKFLQLKTALNITLIEDGLEEFEEWIHNPQDLDDDDFFGLDDDFSDSEAPTNVADQENPHEEADNEELVKFCEQWLKQLKLVKLLFLSINKSLPSMTAGSDIDEIYQTENKIARHVDLLVVELMMNRELNDEVTRLDGELEKECFKIIRILRSVNKSNEAKVKWCLSWEVKYKELQETK